MTGIRPFGSRKNDIKNYPYSDDPLRERVEKVKRYKRRNCLWGEYFGNPRKDDSQLRTSTIVSST